jgi:CRP/FNR family transcriptional regulator
VIGVPWQRRRLLEAFPFLQATPEAFRAELFAQVALVPLPVGQLICHDGAHCTQLPLVLTGTGRVYKLSENGREITLYRVHPGESCVITASCILSDRTFPAFAVCESAVEAVVVRPAEVRRWMATSEPWREYIFGLMASRLREVFGVLDEVLFQRLDQRLIAYLLGLQESPSGGDIPMTHQALAVELGSSREVISRVLKSLESQGLLRTTRGVIELLDIPALELRAREG